VISNSASAPSSAMSSSPPLGRATAAPGAAESRHPPLAQLPALLVALLVELHYHGLALAAAAGAPLGQVVVELLAPRRGRGRRRRERIEESERALLVLANSQHYHRTKDLSYRPKRRERQRAQRVQCYTLHAWLCHSSATRATQCAIASDRVLKFPCSLGQGSPAVPWTA